MLIALGVTRYGAIFYSLLPSCILAKVRPYDYLVDVLQRIDSHPANDVHLLTPQEWSHRYADDPIRSALA